jgi:hypothetical protein
VRIAAALRGGLHPFHVAVGAFGQELPQALRREGDGIGGDDPDDVETKLPRSLLQRLLEPRRLRQKSRLA